MSLIYIYKDVNNITNDPVITDNVKVRVLRDQDVNKEERKAFLEFRDHGNVESVAYMHTNESWHDIYNYRYVLHEIFKAIGVGFSFDHCDLDDYAILDENEEQRGFNNNIKTTADIFMNTGDKENTGYEYTEEFYDIVDRFLKLFNIDYYYSNRKHTRLTILEKGFEEVEE